MKKFIPQFSTAIIALVALTFLMSYTKPAADEPKQYMVLHVPTSSMDPKQFEIEVDQKLAEGWHLQGGVSASPNSFNQALIK